MREQQGMARPLERIEKMTELKKVRREREQVAELYSRLIASTLIRFPEKGLVAPRLQGVYVIYGRNDRVLHVGSTPSGFQGIWQRLQNHLGKASSFTRVHLKGNGAQLRKGFGFRCLAVRNHRLRALLEHYAIGHLCPAHLGLHNKGNKPSMTKAIERRIIQMRASV